MKNVSILSLLLFLMALLFGFTGCGYTGNGNVKVERRDVSSFTKVNISQSSAFSGLTFGETQIASFVVKCIPDSVDFVSIEFDENLLHHIKTETVNDILNIRIQKPLRSRRDIQVHIHYRLIDRVEASGASELIFSPTFKGENLVLDISGASTVSGDFDAENLTVDLSGAADLRFTGKARTFTGDFSGASSVTAFELLTDSCMLDISGASDVEISVSKYLKVDASGASSIHYKGNPVLVSDISGAADITRDK